jgi:hypothetical protein
MHRDESFECDFVKDEVVYDDFDLKLRSKDLKELVENNLENWEVKILDLIKYDRSNFIF